MWFTNRLAAAFLVSSVLFSTSLAYHHLNSPKRHCDSIHNLTALDFDFLGVFSSVPIWSPYPRFQILDGKSIKWHKQNITFALINPAFDHEAKCSSLALLGPGEYYPCSGLPWGHWADFSFDRESHQLRVRYGWICPDTNALYRVKARIGMRCVKAETVEKPSDGWVKCEQLNATTLPIET
ncbi:hypothetical protein CP532_3372 [Ophiocordyceps camponoti-leonardi (nom. inval.)]|nr:hypothetical protein CP532_3372 [Ophiocordyceps camponoti-leonardi (nom. inval.)]